MTDTTKCEPNSVREGLLSLKSKALATATLLTGPIVIAASYADGVSPNTSLLLRLGGFSTTLLSGGAIVADGVVGLRVLLRSSKNKNTA